MTSKPYFVAGEWRWLVDWISVRDRMPEDRQRVLTYDPQSYFKVNVHQFYLDYGNAGGPWFIGGGQNHYVPNHTSITHWSELPSDVPTVECSDEECVHHGSGGDVCIQCEDQL